MTHNASSAPQIFRILTSAGRWQIVQQIATRGEVSVADLQKLFNHTRPSISYHIKILSSTGLIEVHKRGRNHFCALNDRAVRELIEELGNVAFITLRDNIF